MMKEKLTSFAQLHMMAVTLKAQFVQVIEAAAEDMEALGEALMGVQSEIDRIQDGVASAYAAVAEKGGEVPAQQTVANLAAAVASIPAGGTVECSRTTGQAEGG